MTGFVKLVVDAFPIASVGSQLKRYFAIVVAAAGLAGALVLNPVAAAPVGACGGFYVEQNGPVGGVQVYDSSAGVWTWINFEIVTYNDGCGNRFYRLWEWVSDGTVAHLHLDLRVWVCGTFQGVWTGDIWASSGYQQSPTFYYNPWCGRQADDSGSSIGAPWFYYPSYGNAYVTAG